MIPPTPRSTRIDTRFPYTSLFRSPWPADGADERLAGVAAGGAAPSADARLLVGRAYMDRRRGIGLAGRRSGGGRAVPATGARPGAAGGGRRGARRKARARAALPARIRAVARAVR